MKSKYIFHARNADAPLVVVDLCFTKGSYGEFDYAVLFEKDVFTAYLSDKGVRETHDFGLKLLDDQYYGNLLEEINGLFTDCRNLQTAIDDGVFAKQEFSQQWIRVKQLLETFGQIYRHCEQPMLAGLEEMVIKAVADKADLNRLLENPNEADAFGFSELDKKALEILVKIGQLKFDMHNEVGIVYVALAIVAEPLQKKYGLTQTQAWAIRTEEMDTVITGQEPPSKEVLDERIAGSIFLSAGDQTYFDLFTGETYREWKAHLSQDTQEIKGRPACNGKAKGPVKIHMSTFRGSDIPPGSVVVTGMTNPQLVPYLKNAVAIVTDEGGLTCHAAIVSRELNIPCIVGTKNATQVLKDGDLVEVDADDGIVQIIK